MDFIRYIYRYFRNSFIRFLVLFFAKKLSIGNNALIVSPHPDDEILGCGALIKRMNASGKNVSIVFLTKGENTTPKINKQKLIEARRNLTIRALGLVGQPLEKVHFLDYEDGIVRFNNSETTKLIQLIDNIKPDSIYVTNRYEGWNDHVQACNIIEQIAAEKGIKFYEYCVWFWYTMPFKTIFKIQWKNTRYIKMNREERKAKISAIEIYMRENDPNSGTPYSGALPKILIKSCGWPQEFYFVNLRQNN